MNIWIVLTYSSQWFSRPVVQLDLADTICFLKFVPWEKALDLQRGAMQFLLQRLSVAIQVSNMVPC
jgi:hypothetical protein